MYIEKQQISLKELGIDYPMELSEDSLIFDIETTGFSPKTSFLYMIGWVSYKDGCLNITQILSSQKEEEKDILKEFTGVCGEYTRCITYNGDGFDIPFLNEKAKKYGLPCPTAHFSSADIYKMIKPIQAILKLENLKQKTLENFLGIKRNDLYSGGELIRHYFEYEKSRSQVEEKLLLLHNYEDLVGLIHILSMVSYRLAFNGEYRFLDATRIPDTDYFGNKTENLLICAQLTRPVPKPVSYTKNNYYLTLNDTMLKLAVPVVEDKIYVPYTDYKNYYYLEKEDMAILKELAGAVDKADRKPATLETSYGKFLLNEENIHSEKVFQPYIKQVLDLLVKWV